MADWLGPKLPEAEAHPWLRPAIEAVQGPLGSDELQWLDAFRRLRWAVQAAYFAWRLAANDLTGIAGQAENEKGLADARRGLAQLGLDTG
jgi:homoserine kinase type II